MNKKYDELEYAYAVGRIRVLETKMISRFDYEKLLLSTDVSEAVKFLTDLGYNTSDNFDDMLYNELIETFRLIKSMGGEGFLKTQRVKYDYHNAKVLLKSELTKINADSVLMDCGNIEITAMKNAILSRDYYIMSPSMKNAIAEATEQYTKTADLALVDIILDLASFVEMLFYADAQPDSFVFDMIKTQIDIYNVKAFVRAVKIGRDSLYISRIIASGGHIDRGFFVKNASESFQNMAQVFEKTIYSNAFQGSEGLDLALDNLFIEKADAPRKNAFGIAPLAGYFWAKENEIRNIRIILTCIKSGISADVIRKRLRGAF